MRCVHGKPAAETEEKEQSENDEQNNQSNCHCNRNHAESAPVQVCHLQPNKIQYRYTSTAAASYIQGNAETAGGIFSLVPLLTRTMETCVLAARYSFRPIALLGVLFRYNYFPPVPSASEVAYIASWVNVKLYLLTPLVLGPRGPRSSSLSVIITDRPSYTAVDCSQGV